MFDMESRSQKINLAAAIICILLAAAMIAVAAAVYGASFAGLVVFAFFILVYVLLPGYFILKKLPLKITHISTGLTLALFTGWSAEIILYLINDIIPADVLLYAAGPLMSAALLAELIRDPKRKRPDIRDMRGVLAGIPVSAWIFFALVFLFAMLTTQYIYLSPSLSESVYVNPDKAYHMGLVASLSHGYPLESLWINGRIVNYHIFAEMLYSIPVRLFGLRSDFVLMSCGPVMTTVTLCLSVYSFFKEMSARPERAGLYSLLLLLSSFFITRNYYNSIALIFTITNDNASGFGVAAALAFVTALKLCEEQNDSLSRGKKIPLMILLTALVMLTTGIKGPMGAVLVLSLWGTVVLGWILRKVPFSRIIPLALMTAGFLLVYTQVLGSKGQTNAGGNSIFGFGNIVNICFWKDPLTEFMKSAGVPHAGRLAVIFLLFFICYLTAFLLPFCAGYVRELIQVLSGKKEYKLYRVLVYAVFAVGFIAMFVLSYSGHSQIYFGLVSLYFAPVIAFWFFEDMESADLSGRKTAKGMVTAVRAVFAVSIACTGVLLMISLYNELPDCRYSADPSAKYDKYTSMSHSEYEAMEWLRTSTPEDSLLATDRYYSVSLKTYDLVERWDNRFFLYGSYSNRFCYIAGSGYNMKADEFDLRKEMLDNNKKLYDPANDRRGDDARELGVDYVVVSKRFTDIPTLENKDYKLCFSNKDIDIYEVLPAD